MAIATESARVGHKRSPPGASLSGESRRSARRGLGYTVAGFLQRADNLRSVRVLGCDQTATRFSWKSRSPSLTPRYDVATWQSRKTRVAGPDFPRLKRQ